MVEMKVGFYGHVRQYHNLRAEIDGAIEIVLRRMPFGVWAVSACSRTYAKVRGARRCRRRLPRLAAQNHR